MVTSVVSLVIRLADENLSIFLKENVWIFSNIDILRFLAKPVDAFAPHAPPLIPAKRPIAATTIIIPPVLRITDMSPWPTPSSTITAMRSGIIISIATSNII